VPPLLPQGVDDDSTLFSLGGSSGKNWNHGEYGKKPAEGKQARRKQGAAGATCVADERKTLHLNRGQPRLTRGGRAAASLRVAVSYPGY